MLEGTLKIVSFSEDFTRYYTDLELNQITGSEAGCG